MSSELLVTVKVEGTQRSSRASSARRARRGLLRMGRVLGPGHMPASKLPILERVLMETSQNKMTQDETGLQTVRPTGELVNCAGQISNLSGRFERPSYLSIDPP